MYKVSIIIPVYNAESTLKKAIYSVINQTIGFENIELILIDDHSSDDSKRIINDFSTKYDNIKPIFLSNNSGSPSTPRNIGIENATAPFLMFLDNDDELFEDYCEVLYNSIFSNNVDIVNCNHSSKLNNKVYIPKSIDKISFKENKLYGDDKFNLKLAAWANIYNSDFIKKNNIKFPSSLYEDGVFYLHCLLKTNKPVIRLFDYPGYIYLIENYDSITHKANLNTLNRFLEGYAICGDLLTRENQEKFKQKFFTSFVNMAIFILIKLDDLDKGVRTLSEFENSLGFKIILYSKPLNLINSKIIYEQFFQAKLLIRLVRLFYNNKLIKNHIFINYSNLKILKEY